ncbi:hypothetical protein ANK2_1937 [plant metagenome]|uniref:Uncharacterized protein n=1 Tax=plant metagenome TaxID=1297885 RepID=A0A484SB97_9ZZZZ
MRHFVHLRDRTVHLLDAGRLLLRGRRDLAHDVRHALDRLHDLLHGRACALDLLRARAHLADRVFDQALDFLGRLRAALRQRAHFARHHREALALFARTRGFHCGIQRQDVGLERNAVDDRHDFRDLLRAGGDGLHRADHLRHGGATAVRDLHAAGSQLVGLAGVVGVLAHGAGQLFHAGGGFFQRGGLLLGAAAQVGVAGRDLTRAHVDFIHAMAHGSHGARQAFLHAAQRGEQLADFVVGAIVHALRQVARRDAVEQMAGAHQRLDDHAAEHDAHQDHQQDRQHDRGAHGSQADLEVALGLFGDLGLLAVDVVREGADGLDECRAARRAVLRVDHVEGRIVLAGQSLHHRVDAIVQVSAIAAHQVHGHLAARLVFQHVLLEIAKAFAHGVQALLRVVERGRGVLRGGHAGAGFLLETCRDHQAHAGLKHVAVDHLHLVVTLGQAGLVVQVPGVLVQEESSQCAHARDHQREQAQHQHDQGADTHVTQTPPACLGRDGLLGLGVPLLGGWRVFCVRCHDFLRLAVAGMACPAACAARTPSGAVLDFSCRLRCPAVSDAAMAPGGYCLYRPA